MGLFGLFGKKEQYKSKEYVDLEVYSGMQVEVTSQEGNLLFIAKMLRVVVDTAELLQYSESDLPPMAGPIPVRIRGYSGEDSKAVYLEGKVHLDVDRIWKVEDLKLIKTGNDRAFFRLDTNIEAMVKPLGRAGAQEEPCKVLNISVGGACIGTRSQFETGERCLLTVRFFPEGEVSFIHCQILREVKRDGKRYQYGCRFIELSEAGQDKIMQAIFALQRKKRSYR